MEDDSSTFKLVLLGEGRCGKTSLLVRYIHDTFSDKQQSTVQAAQIEKDLLIGRRKVTLSIWDTAGQERFHALGPIYYRGANGAVLVYDITDPDSFVKVRDWVKELRVECGPDIVLVIVGNKIDLMKDKRVDIEEAKGYAESIGASHLLSSAKSGKGVEDIFLEVTKAILTKQNNAAASAAAAIQPKKAIEIIDEPVESKKCC
jgi:Ras-related protein Rab-21